MNAELLKTVLKDNANLKAYYRFESGALTTDSSGQGRTLTNNNTVTEGTGVYGGCADFGTGNTNKYFSVTNDMGIQGGTGSINCWIKTPTTTSASDHESFVGVGDAGTQTELVIFLGGTGIGCARLKSAVAWQKTAEKAISANTWYMATLTYDGTTLRSYINGSHFASASASGNGSGTDEIDQLSIGRRTNPTSVTYADGLIDDVAIFSSALSADQIKELYEGRFLGEAWPNIAQQTYSKELATTSLAINTNLKAYYKFENGALTTDSSGNSHTLTAISDPADTAGKFGGAVDLDGNDAYSHADHADFKPTGSFSLVGWINFTGSYAGDTKTIFQSFAYPSKYSGFRLTLDYTTGTKLAFISGKNTGFTENTDFAEILSAALNDGNWHHFCATSDGAYLKLYIDGKLSSQKAWAYAPAYHTTNYVRIGCGNNSGTEIAFFTGKIDDLALLNGIALTSEQVEELYSIRGGLVAGYHLSNETDFSGNNYNLTNNNTATFGAGKFGNKAAFNGSNQSLSINNSFGIDGGNISISAWINPTTVTSASDHLSYVALYGNTTKTSYNLFVGTTGIGATRLRAGVAWDETSQKAITAGIWTHAVLTYDATNLRLYINGNLFATTACSGNGSGSATSKATLGCRADVDALTGQLATSLDEVLFFNRVLSSREIRRMYALGVGKYD